MPLLQADRDPLLRSKRQESSSLIATRKRKLRELYSVSSSLEPIPRASFYADAPISTQAEARFLEQNDLAIGRTFDERSIPARRLRSGTARISTLSNGDSPLLDSVRHSGKGTNGERHRRIRASSPDKDVVDEVLKKPREDKDLAGNGFDGHEVLPRLREVSPHGTQVEHTPDEEAGHQSKEDLAEPRPHLPLESSERTRIDQSVESRPSSPGVDPQQVLPMFAEDAANLPDLLTMTPRDKNHKAATIHLPPKEVQEERLRQRESQLRNAGEESNRQKRLDDLSIKLPSHHATKIGEALSSPGSTVGPQSATTPGNQYMSTDTSPDNEGPRYDAVDQAQGKDVQSPSNLPDTRHDRLEVGSREEHDKILKAQVDAVRSDILGSSPTAADAQLHLEEKQAASASHLESEATSTDIAGDQRQNPIRQAGEIVQDTVDDEEDEVVGVPTPEDEGIPEPKSSREAQSHENEADPMDVDAKEEEGDSDKLKGGSNVPPKEPRVDPTNQGDSTAAMSTTTPRRTPSSTAPTPPSQERMATRVSTGAMRHKSVSEILGEPSKLANVERADKAMNQNSSSNSRSSTPQSPGSRARSIADRARDKERSKLSTVIFAKQPLNRSSGNTSLIQSSNKSKIPESNDYFMPLFVASAYASTRGHQSLDSLLLSAHKTITTSNAYVPYHDHQTLKILSRIRTMQKEDKWSFRQPKRAPEPNRPITHWDELLKEMKWLRTDFREERKWKMAAARNLAYACAEWIEADDEDRKLLQVRARPPALETSKKNNDLVVAGNESSLSDVANIQVPDLVASTENDSQADDFEDEISTSILETIAPAAIFSLGDEDVVFSFSRSAASDKILDELPMFGVPLKVPQSDLPTSDVDPDSLWKRPALPLSKYVEGKLVLKSEGPPRKRSRFEYEEESDDEDRVIIEGQAMKQETTESPVIDVALFNPENKHIRDRIQAGHQFRPPSENPMPLQSFFECRNSSHWLWAEDDELKSLVREYSYNWQLISNFLASKSLFTSGADRRTPWECFERWIHLEGLPADMSKTQYFRAYNHRLEAAQRTLVQQAQQAAQAPQQNGTGSAMAPIRRRATTSIRVERKRNQKHLTLFDAMRKLAKKREANLQKQAHAQHLASTRKEQNQAAHTGGMRHTPQEFSKLKHDRETQLQDRMHRLQMQQNSQRQQALQQARNAQPNQNSQQYGVPNSTQPPRPPTSGNAPGQQHPQMQGRPNQLAVPGQNVPHAPLQSVPNGGIQAPSQTNGHPGGPQMHMKGISQAQIQGLPGLTGHPTPHRMPQASAPQERLIERAQYMQAQQRQAILQQQQGQQQPGQNAQMQNSASAMRPNMNGATQQAFGHNNQGLVPGFSGVKPVGNSTPPGNAFNINNTAGQVGSPRLPPPHQGNQHIPQIPLIESTYLTNNPGATPEQVQKHVKDLISRTMNPQQQSREAMMAAAGNTGNGVVSFANSGAHPDPRQYAQMLRAQQREQAQANQANQGIQADGQTPTHPQPAHTHQMQSQGSQQQRSASTGSATNS